MPTVRDLRDRIRSLKNTQQITKAMKQVAAAKIRRAEAAQKRARPYADALAEMLADLIAAVSRSTIRSAARQGGRARRDRPDQLRQGARRRVQLQRHRARRSDSRAGRARALLTVGLKARNAVRRLGMPDHPTWPLGAVEDRDRPRGRAPRLRRLHAGTISEIVLVSQKLISMMSQRPETRKLVPITRRSSSRRRLRGAPERSPSERSRARA